jgi:transcriptional regulator with XRE-family HTH domain
VAFGPGKHLRALREQVGWTQAEVADLAGIDVVELSRFESGGGDPRSATIDRIAAVLGAALWPGAAPTTQRPDLGESTRRVVRSGAPRREGNGGARGERLEVRRP